MNRVVVPSLQVHKRSLPTSFRNRSDNNFARLCMPFTGKMLNDKRPISVTNACWMEFRHVGVSAIMMVHENYSSALARSMRRLMYKNLFPFLPLGDTSIFGVTYGV